MSSHLGSLSMSRKRTIDSSYIHFGVSRHQGGLFWCVWGSFDGDGGWLLVCFVLFFQAAKLHCIWI